MDHRLLVFCLAAAVLIVVPGPSVVFAVGRALSVGRRRALAAVAGNELGLMVQVAAVAGGLGALVTGSAVAFTALKLAGAAYLVVLGVNAIRHRHEAFASLGRAGTVPDGRRGAGRAVLDGLAVGALNPKSAVFFTAFLPQFVDPGAPVAGQVLLLGAMFTGIALVLDSLWVLAAGTARAWFARSPRRLGVVGGTGGVVMIGLGVGVAVSE
ncbi:LysE family translocator [Actinomycetospora sp.]|uniref:LysE family translocator n=1 Tax=Actinomycetospora sp. TaxID=1872135 RepID=UPI002F3FD2A4